MKKLYILLLLLSTFMPSIGYSSEPFEISEIYIEAQGNNKYESKFKAYQQGMQRALLLIADKMGIPASDISHIPYGRLKEAFVITDVIGEKEREDSYSATVTYHYDLYTINKLLLDYGVPELTDKFYEFVVFPIFKQRKVINIWDPKPEWNAKWLLARAKLEENHLLMPAATKELMKVITPANIFDLTYQNYIETFWPVLFKKILLVVAEYFTDNDTGNSILSIKYVIIEPFNKKTVLGDEYPINSFAEASGIINNVIDGIIHNYGRPNSSSPVPVDIDDLEAQLINPQDKPLVGSEGRMITFYTEVFDEEELKQIEQKIHNVKEIKSFTVTREQEKKYKIVILTDYTEADIAESFYLNGLSFKIYGNLYNLIDIKEGG